MAVELSDIIDLYRDVLIQIATPYSTGTGFYLRDHNIIVTNEHVIRGNRQVVITGREIKRQLAQVLFFDIKYDLAFLSPPEEILPKVSLTNDVVVREGDQVIAIGHPFGLKFSATNGIVSNTLHRMNDIDYLQHDAALNPGNSGGPLVTMDGHVAGVNTFIIRDGNNIGFSLPSRYLSESIYEFEARGSIASVRCHACGNFVSSENIDTSYCPHCGTRIELPNMVEEYEPIGVNKTIEMMLSELNHNIDLARIGPNLWQIEQGSAKITVAYHEETGLIIGDAFLVQLPKQDIEPIYQYLLKENYNLKNLAFSIRGNDIILSLIIYDRYLNVETGKTTMQMLFEKADHYDNVLVDEFGAQWKS